MNSLQHRGIGMTSERTRERLIHRLRKAVEQAGDDPMGAGLDLDLGHHRVAHHAGHQTGESISGRDVIGVCRRAVAEFQGQTGEFGASRIRHIRIAY